MLLVKGNLPEAKRRLCASADEASGNNAAETHVSSTDVLKAQKTFSASLSEYLAVGDISAAATTLECLIMLNYLAGDGATEPMSGSQGNISAAMETLHSASQGFNSRGYSQSTSYERVVQFAAHLLYIHATKGYVGDLTFQLIAANMFLKATPASLHSRATDAVHKRISLQ